MNTQVFRIFSAVMFGQYVGWRREHVSLEAGEAAIAKFEEEKIEYAELKAREAGILADRAALAEMSEVSSESAIAGGTSNAHYPTES